MSTVTSGLSLIYRPDKAHLWVEDSLTREYLDECWQDADIQIHIGGGNQTIRAVAHDAANQGWRHVVGLIDRDYGQSNYAQWSNPNSGARVLVLPAHELENYLLQEDALAGCTLNTLGRSVADIVSHLRHVASLCEWQVSACKVIAGWHDLFNSDFPSHPSRNQAHDQPSALAVLQNYPWYAQVTNRATRVAQAGEPLNSLTTAHGAVAGWLAGVAWKQEFPGKELYRDIRGFVYSPAPGGAPGAGVQADIDVAKAIARWQRANNGVPAEIQELRTVVRAKAGI